MLYQRWIVQSQFYMSFDEFRSKLKPKTVNEDEILQDVESILRSLEVKNGII